MRLGIQGKLIAAFLALTMIPLLLVSGFSYVVSARTLEAKVREFSHDVLAQTALTVERKIGGLEEVSFNVALDDTAQRMLERSENVAISELDLSRLQKSAQAFFSSYVLFNDSVNAIFLEANSGVSLELTKKLEAPDPLALTQAEISQGAGSPVWKVVADDSSVLVLGRQVNSLRNQKTLGYLRIFVQEDYLFESVRNSQTTLGGQLQILDRDGVIVSSTDRGTLGTQSNVRAHAQGASAYTFETATINGMEVYVATTERLSNGWSIVAVVPVIEYQSEVIALRRSLFFGCGVLLLVAVATAVVVARNVSTPIRNLSTVMEEFGRGELGRRTGLVRNDEIGDLAKSFNSMAENIEQLVNQVHEEQITKQEIELYLLRMQINPHFLYNTLDTINWMARSAGATDAGETAQSLGRLLRTAIDAHDFVALEDELEQLNDYLNIQQHRFAHTLTIKREVQEEALAAQVPSLILQPLVENALLNGISPSFDGGVITISAQVEQENLVLRVADDGVGMSPETVKKVYMTAATKSVESRESIGLQNVIRRLRAIYAGRECLTVSSELGEGTEVTITIPVRT